ncbi:hypothetical protein AYO47_00115 [Planctomyces sp. SCGC AG-212-M04]|nr:hypothetical protein AYO47_00115 [Planctomyces sp. SCGC AG-212-M04]
MTDTPPKPKRRRWRWQRAGALIFTVAVFALRDRRYIDARFLGNGDVIPSTTNWKTGLSSDS